MPYCILVTGIPASGKSTIAKWLGQKLSLPVLSKDEIKEELYDTVGFASRKEKVRLGEAAQRILYRMAYVQLRTGRSVILENNFEFASEEGLRKLLEDCCAEPITIVLTGDYETVYQRFVARNHGAARHLGHVVNTCYPNPNHTDIVDPTIQEFVSGIEKRGMDRFSISGPRLIVDTSDFANVDLEKVYDWLRHSGILEA